MGRTVASLFAGLEALADPRDPVWIGELDAVMHGLLRAEARRAAPSLGADEADFNQMAMTIHRAQRAAIPTLRRFWDRAGAADVDRWQDVPPVPTAAFRETTIASGPAQVVYRTSGTSAGADRRGEHHVRSDDLYLASARAGYRRHLFANARALELISLIPQPHRAWDSSLSAMAGFISDEREVVRATWAFDPETGPAVADFRAAAKTRRPVLLLATSFALAALLDALEGEPAPLPRGSRLMRTGGFKGRAAEESPAALAARVERLLGVPPSRVVDEYGMTELLSQAYDGVAGRVSPGAPHRFPPWVRTRALDPATLAPLPHGREGLLAHFDLANVGSVCHVLTEDWGATTADGGVRLAGRAPGAEVRGCSLTAEEFLGRG